MQYIKLGSKEHKRASTGVLIGSTITFALMYSPQPLISLFSKQYNIPPQTAGLSISLTTIALAVSMLLVSVFASSWSRKGLMSISLILTACLTIIASFVPSFSFFLVLRLFEGISIACFPSIAMAYLNEEFSPKDMGRVTGYFVAGNAVGGLIGRIVTGVLTDLTNWHISFLIMGVLSLLGSLWFLVYLPKPNNFTKIKVTADKWVADIKVTLLNKKLFPVYITGLLQMGAYVSVLNYIGYPLTKAPFYLSQTVFGFLFLVNVFGIYSSVLFGKLADKHPRRYVLSTAILIFTVGVLLTLDSHLIIKIAGVAVVAFGFMAAHSVASGWIGVLAEKNQKGQASSMFMFFYYSGSSLFGWSGGKFLNNFGWNGLVCFICILLVTALLVTCKPWTMAYKKRAAVNP
jgi:YNFM family putative membrane transporter